MSQWYVELTSRDKVLLAFLTTCLQEPSYTIIETNSERFYIIDKEGQRLYRSSDLPTESEDNRYYWLSSDFDQYTDPQDVLMKAWQQLPLLNSIIKLKYGVYVSFIDVVDVYRADEHCRFIKETATVPPLSGRRVTSENLLQAENAQYPNIAALWRVERTYPEVERTMRYYAQRYDWMSLRKVYEEIKGDVAALTFDQWTQSWRDNFRESANNAHLSSDDALHSLAASHLVPSGVTTMSLREANECISNLLIQWLQTKPT
jgi:hypothetical protein